MRKGIAMLLAAAMLWLCVGCGDDEPDSNKGAGHNFSYTLVGNPDTLDPQLAVNASAQTVLCNMFEGLLVLGADGAITNGVAESYTVSEDRLQYTFKLRDDSYWYQVLDKDSPFNAEEKRAVTAEDFVFAFQRIFDPKYESPYQEAFSCIQNGREVAKGIFPLEKLGVVATAADTLEITLEYPNSGFPMLLTTTAALPCNQEYFENAKGRYGLDEASVMGNGSFAMQRWLYDPYGKYNVIQMVRNPLNHAVNRVYPADLQFFIEKTDADAARIFTEGSADCYVSTQNSLLGRSDYHVEGAYSLTLGLIVNPDSHFSEPHVLQAMRLSLDRFALGLNSTDVQPAAGILPPAVMLLNKSCRELIADGAYQKYDLAEADRLVHKGMRKLGVSELETGTVLCCTGMMDYSLLRQVLEKWESALDVHFTIEEVAEQEYERRITTRDYGIALYAVGGENNTAPAIFEHLLADRNILCTEERTVRDLLERAATTPNLTDCVSLYRQAEEAVLSDDCFLPLFYKQRYLICKAGVSDIQFNPFSGQLQFTKAKFSDS